MIRLIIYIAVITFIILLNDQFCQSKPIKSTEPIPSKEVKVIVDKPTTSPNIKAPKPKGESIIVREKPQRKIKHSDPPQRPQKHTDPSLTRRSHTQRGIADAPPQVYICRSGSIRRGYVYYDYVQTDEIENDFLYEEEEKDYDLDTKFFNGIEFTDENFPISINKIEFKYLRSRWINSNDFPENMLEKESGNYLIYSIKCDAYILDQSYDYPFAALITFPDYSSEIVLFNYNSEYLEADSVYSFEEVITLKQTGYAWLTLGFYDFEYDQFYSAALSPYLTKQKIFIPEPHKQYVKTD